METERIGVNCWHSNHHCSEAVRGGQVSVIKDIEIMRKQGLSFAQIASKLGGTATKDSVQKLYRGGLDNGEADRYHKKAAKRKVSNTAVKQSNESVVTYTDPYTWLLSPAKRDIFTPYFGMISTRAESLAHTASAGTELHILND